MSFMNLLGYQSYRMLDNLYGMNQYEKLPIYCIVFDSAVVLCSQISAAWAIKT